VLDYGHNQAAIVALGEAVTALGPRRTILALGLPGDRRDEDLCATIDATLSWVDVYVLYDLEDRRGREPGEVPRMLEQRLPLECERMIVANQHEALRVAWNLARPGDRLVLVVDETDNAIHQMEELSQSYEADKACSVPIHA
jgi:cyanophycin synthetase